MRKLKNILGVSAGNGILLHPFLKSELKVLGNIETRNDYTIQGQPRQWYLNFPEDTYWNKELNWTHYNADYPDIIIGHPKCGNSSKLALSRGKEYRSDKHRSDPSFTTFIEAVFDFEPKVWLLENLPKLMEEFTIEELKKMTDTPYIQVLKVNDLEWGGSQETRNRIVIVGSKIPLALPIIRVSRTEPADCLIAMPDLMNGHFCEAFDKSIAIYGGQQLTIEQIKEYWFKYKPDRKFTVIDPVQRERMNHAPGVYINWEGMLPKTARKSNRQFNHYGYPMSPRELARIQNVPDDFTLLDYREHSIGAVTALNKSRITVGSTPSYNVGKWFLEILNLNKLI